MAGVLRSYCASLREPLWAKGRTFQTGFRESASTHSTKRGRFMSRHMFATSRQFALAIALCMGCGASDHADVSLDAGNASCSTRAGGGAGPSGTAAVPADPLFAACRAGDTLQGSCAPGLVCTQIGPSDGPHCFEPATATGDCLHGTDETFMGLVCAPRCVDSSACSAGLQCYPPGAAAGWCVPP
jgi:hypothetical protein